MPEAFYSIYNNLFKYLDHRGIKAEKSPMERVEFFKIFNDESYVDIKGNKIVIILINPEKKYAKLDNNMKSLLKKYSRDEILVVTNVSYSTDQHIVKIKGIISSLDRQTTLINFRSYLNFIYDIPNHALSSKHKIISKDEIKNEFNLVYLGIKELPKIYDYDAQATWIGARVGDIIEIERVSPMAGITTTYREVISKIHTL